MKPQLVMSAVLVLLALFVAEPKSAHADTIYVVNNRNSVGEYNGSTGATINADLILGNGLAHPVGVAVDGSGDLFVTNTDNGTIAEYNASTGALINPGFIGGLNDPQGILFNDGHLYVANAGNGTVGEYNASTSAAINANFITGLNGPSGLALDGSGNLYVVATSFATAGTIGEYNASTGAAVNANLITGVGFDAYSLAVDGSGLSFVAPNDFSVVAEYNAITGAAINTSFITGLTEPIGLALNGGNLYVVNGTVTGMTNQPGYIGEYNATTGATINADFITGLDSPQFIAFAPPSGNPAVPEPSTLTLFGIGIAGIAAWRRRKKAAT